MGNGVLGLQGLVEVQELDVEEVKEKIQQSRLLAELVQILGQLTVEVPARDQQKKQSTVTLKTVQVQAQPE